MINLLIYVVQSLINSVPIIKYRQWWIQDFIEGRLGHLLSHAMTSDTPKGRMGGSVREDVPQCE